MIMMNKSWFFKETTSTVMYAMAEFDGTNAVMASEPLSVSIIFLRSDPISRLLNFDFLLFAKTE